MNVSLAIKVLSDEEFSLAFRLPQELRHLPEVRVRRGDILYALLCGAGVITIVPCQVMPKEDMDEPL